MDKNNETKFIYSPFPPVSMLMSVAALELGWKPKPTLK